MRRDWEAHYAAGETPWDTGQPAPTLVRLVEAGRLPRGRALDIGCGTGTNSRFLASRGYQVVGVDISQRAIERATAATNGTKDSIGLCQLDFLVDPPPAGRFDLVFDRGCLHVFDEPADQRRFAARVAACLEDGGIWLSLLGSTEGPARDFGPPRRSARDIVNAVEPALEIVELCAMEFEGDLPSPASAWRLLARRRSVPAQPSTT